MKKHINSILFVLLLIHIIVLYVWGISTFITTFLVYWMLYILLKKIISYIKNEKWRDIISRNLRNLIIIILVVEFSMTFIKPFTFLNNYMEREKGVFFSEYKRKKQCELLQRFGIKRARFVFEEGNLPNSVRTITKDEFSYNHTYNDLGLRGKLPPLQKSQNEIRIILLGDSFIEGEGTPDDSTISVLLEKKLNQLYPEKLITVINGGISGSSPIYNHRFLIKNLIPYHPDIVISSVFSNDLWDTHIGIHQGCMPTYDYIFAISHLARLIYFGGLKYYNFSVSNPPNKMKLLRKELLGKLNQDFINFKNQLKGQKIKTITMYIPSSSELLSKQNLRSDENHLSNFMNYDIQLLKQFDEYTDGNPSDFINKYYWKNDAHFKPEGYNLVAEIISLHLAPSLNSKL